MNDSNSNRSISGDNHNILFDDLDSNGPDSNGSNDKEFDDVGDVQDSLSSGVNESIEDDLFFSNSSDFGEDTSTSASDNDSSFLKGDSDFDLESNFLSDGSDSIKLNEAIIPILNEQLSILQNAVQAIPTIIQVCTKSMKESKRWGGSIPGKSPNKERNFEAAYEMIMSDYFSGEDSTYNEQDFERRFRISPDIFDTIYNRIVGKSLFVHKMDATKKLGIHPLCRFVACIRYLAYGSSFDSLDEYCRLSETSVHKSVKEFTKLLIVEFGDEFLNRSPTDEECDSILLYNETRGFPGMLASWDCTHFNWKKCPTALHGQYKGRKESKSLVLEAVVDCDLRFWYINFGRPGSLNDLNILNQSSIVRKLLRHDFKIATKPYTINHTVRDYMYFLVDGIYPPWSIFVPTIKNPRNIKEKIFSKQQEGCRKDIERVFACLSQKFQILQRDIRLWYIPEISDVLKACIIMHNMCVVDRISKVGRDKPPVG